MDRLAELREKRVLTLRELSGMSGVSPDTINQIELGRRRPRPSTLRKLARALDVDTKDFFEPEEMTASPKAAAPLSFSRWLLERCGHSYLTLSEEELRQRFGDLEGSQDAVSKKRDLFTAVQAEYIATIRTRRLPPEERVLVRGHHLGAVGKWLLAQTLSGQAEGITEAFEQSVKEAIEAVVDETA